MKKLLIVMLVFCLGGVAQGKDWSTWTFSDGDAICGRMGYRLSENVEAGASMYWLPPSDGPRIWGVYGLYEWPDIITVPNPINFDFLPDELNAQTYLGAQLAVDIDSGDIFGGPIAGLVFQDILFLEYQLGLVDGKFDYDLDDEHKIVAGLKIRF